VRETGIGQDCGIAEAEKICVPGLWMGEGGPLDGRPFCVLSSGRPPTPPPNGPTFRYFAKKRGFHIFPDRGAVKWGRRA
jgi:hypothetical protein